MIESLDIPLLPEGWVWTEVGDIGNIVTGTTPSKSKKEYYGNDFPFFKPTDLNNGYYIRKSDDGLSKTGIEKTRSLPAKSILVTCIGATIGKTGFIRTVGASNQQINAIIPEEHILPEFIYFMCISPQFQKSIIDNASATTLPILNKSKFMILPIPLPPLPEQQRIVAKVDELFTKLDAGVESLKNVKAQLRLYHQAVLKHAFKGKLTEEWRERHKDELEHVSVLLERIKEERKKTLKGKYKELPPPRDTSDLPELHEGWVWAKVGEICVTTSGGTPSRKNKRYYGGTIPWLKSGELENKIITSTEEYITKEGLENSSAKIIPAGTLLMALYGATVGKLGILGIDSAINQAICAIFAPSQLEKKYLFWYLMDYRNELLNSRIGGAQPNISQTIVNKVTLPFPSLPEQHKIVEEIELRFSVADDVEKTVDQSLKQAERLRQSILKTAFEGKLVPQDPTDEPASVLLERIKAERENREIEAKSKTKTKRKRDLVLKQRRFNDYVE